MPALVPTAAEDSYQIAMNDRQVLSELSKCYQQLPGSYLRRYHQLFDVAITTDSYRIASTAITECAVAPMRNGKVDDLELQLYRFQARRMQASV